MHQIPRATMISLMPTLDTSQFKEIVLMPLVGTKIGLALMFEDLVKQGIVKKHRTRIGESITLD